VQTLRNPLRKPNDRDGIGVDVCSVEKNEVAALIDGVVGEHRKVAIVFAVGTTRNKRCLTGYAIAKIVARNVAGLGIDLEYGIEGR
jgi:hypothetical protein